MRAYAAPPSVTIGCVLYVLLLVGPIFFAIAVLGVKWGDRYLQQRKERACAEAASRPEMRDAQLSFDGDRCLADLPGGRTVLTSR